LRGFENGLLVRIIVLLKEIIIYQKKYFIMCILLLKLIESTSLPLKQEEFNM
jgi:hypothetical protein